MTEQEDFIVTEAYTPTADEAAAIKELEDKGLVPDDWDSGKNGIKSFKKNFRRYMYNNQNKLCAYCRIHVPICCDPMHREHIVYKSEHPQWMYLPQNLCLACATCNEYKGTIEVLCNPRVKTYPKKGNGFKIIHPLYDRYSEHIELVGDILYRAKTEKGLFTIKTCHLDRVELAEERVDNKRKEEGDIYGCIVGLLSVSEQYVDDNEYFKKYVIDIVREYKERN